MRGRTGPTRWCMSRRRASSTQDRRYPMSSCTRHHQAQNKYFSYPSGPLDKAVDNAIHARIQPAHLYQACCQIDMTPRIHQTQTRMLPRAGLSGNIVKLPYHCCSLKSKVVYYHGRLEDTKESIRHRNSALNDACSVSNRVGFRAIPLPMS